jgi:hypothetical protein
MKTSHSHTSPNGGQNNRESFLVPFMIVSFAMFHRSELASNYQARPRFRAFLN